MFFGLPKTHDFRPNSGVAHRPLHRSSGLSALPAPALHPKEINDLDARYSQVFADIWYFRLPQIPSRPFTGDYCQSARPRQCDYPRVAARSILLRVNEPTVLRHYLREMPLHFDIYRHNHGLTLSHPLVNLVVLTL